MRITLAPLSKKELDFVLEILNLETHKPEGPKALANIEGKTAEYSVRAYGKYLPRGTKVWVNADGDEPLHSLRNRWALAQQTFHSAIVDQRNRSGLFCHLPAIGLPVVKPPALIRDPEDLSLWLVARAVANGQHRLFVKCARKECGRFGRRKRARASSRYCSEECRMIENARRAAERTNGKLPKKIEPLGIAKRF